MRDQSFYTNFTEMIFLQDEPKPSDIIFVPGNGYPQMAEKAAELWKQGYAPYVLPSGKYSIRNGAFSGVMAKKERYSGIYATEWEFLFDVLVKNGVPEEAVLREDQAEYTWQNAIFSGKAVMERGLEIKRGIICCKAQHARRCKLYYQLEFPDSELLVCPSDTGITRDNWYRSEEGVDSVLGEIRRCGEQFAQILREKIPNL